MGLGGREGCVLVKYLIVNADDFGASRGINRGIIEAHQRGVLTSTSLLVNAAASEEAAELSRSAPGLSVGLHADVRDELKGTTDAHRLREALDAQAARFEELMSRPPTHLDSHHNVHRDPRALPYFLDLAREHGLSMREHSPVRYFSKFYGQWGGLQFDMALPPVAGLEVEHRRFRLYYTRICANVTHCFPKFS